MVASSYLLYSLRYSLFHNQSLRQKGSHFHFKMREQNMHLNTRYKLNMTDIMESIKCLFRVDSFSLWDLTDLHLGLESVSCHCTEQSSKAQCCF